MGSESQPPSSHYNSICPRFISIKSRILELRQTTNRPEVYPMARKIYPRLDSLDFSNNFLFHWQMFVDIFAVYTPTSFASRWKGKPRNRSAILLLADGEKNCFLKGRSVLWSCSFRLTFILIFRTQNSKDSKNILRSVLFFLGSQNLFTFLLDLI